MHHCVPKATECVKKANNIVAFRLHEQNNQLDINTLKNVKVLEVTGKSTCPGTWQFWNYFHPHIYLICTTSCIVLFLFISSGLFFFSDFLHMQVAANVE